MTAKFWIGGTANWSNTNDASWSLSSGGPNNTTHPVAGDTVFIDGNSGVGTITRTAATVTCDSIDCTGYTGTLALGSVNTTVAVGNLTLASGMTVNTNTGTWSFTGTGTQVFTSAGKSFSPLTFNGTGTLQLGDNMTIAGGSATFTLTKGTLDLNGKTLACGPFAASNANTRSIIWTGGGTLSPVGLVNFATTTGATFTNPTQGLLAVTMNAQTLSLGTGLVFPPVTIVSVSTSSLQFTSAGSTVTSVTWRPLTTDCTVSLASDLTVSGDFIAIGDPNTGVNPYPLLTGITSARILTVNGKCDMATISPSNITAAGNSPFYIRNADPNTATLAGCTNVIIGIHPYSNTTQLLGVG